MIRISINGEAHEISGAATVGELLTLLNVPPANLVVERNGDVVAPGRLAQTPIADGDVIELVRFVGGG
jgi:thiamine biosynthesis protein ThiS